MDRLQFLSYRLAFSGLPFGELQEVLWEFRHNQRWADACRNCWARLRGIAERAERAGDAEWAAEAWRWIACAYHAASLGFHLEPHGPNVHKRVLRMRRMAHAAYLRALRSNPCLATPVLIPCGSTSIAGYLRLAQKRCSPTVVLFNGLDSICEVEMHAFGDWLLSRGFSVLSLDLPAALCTHPRQPHFAIEKLAPALADWVGNQPDLLADRIGAFGVSFGGHLAARALAGDARFRAGVAVSPAAWIGAKELNHERVRMMLALAFNLERESEVLAMASQIDIMRVSPPRGRLLHCTMEQDELFGVDHVRAYVAWAHSRIDLRNYRAEHVGTSCIHFWLPEACNWLYRQLATKEV